MTNWISILEAVTYPNLLKQRKAITYKDILNGDGVLKTRQDLKQHGMDLEWWEYLQLQARYKGDKKEWGINTQETVLDKILLGSEDKLIGKLYKFPLAYKLEEQVKETMVVCARDFEYSINLDQWQTIWERNKKITMATLYIRKICSKCFINGIFHQPDWPRCIKASL
uniref:Uncharacterized protein n=1 Tax=Micrurus spixii TaxID=129469 RepID=A0A2D4MCI9_9SAUR